MITVMVTGGRDYTDRDHVYRVLDRTHAERTIVQLIHGACGWDTAFTGWTSRSLRGADALADAWAIDRGVVVHRVPARWSRLGRHAGPERNARMVALRPDVCVVFPGGRGTANARALAEAAGIEVVREDVRKETT